MFRTSLGRSIDERPDEVNERSTFGDWEGDSIVGKDGASSALTFTERKTGKAFVLKTDGKTAEATYQALTKLKERCGSLFSYMFKSITFDNGSEFAASELFESLGFTVYYAHPYSAWERGQNEHFNGMLRRFIPKGKDISYLTQDDLDRFAAKLNSLPRRKAHYSTPEDLFNEELHAIMAA